MFLFFITLISLFTVLSINYGSFHLVFILYSLILALTGTTLTIIWSIAIKTKSIQGDMTPSLMKLFLLNSITPPIIFLISIGISLLSIDIAQYFRLTIFPIRIIIGNRFRAKND